MKIIVIALCVLISLSTVACTSYPERTQSQGAQMGGIEFVNAPSSAEIVVNGLPVGSVGDYRDQEGVLALSRGTHRIELRASNGATIFNRTIYIGNAIIEVEI